MSIRLVRQLQPVRRKLSAAGIERAATRSHGQHDVFLSYAREDLALAQKLVAALKARGLDVWYDKMISGGSRWRGEIVRHLKSSHALVVLFSRAVNKSDNLATELAIAEQANIPIIPVKIEEVEPDGDYAFHLQTLQWIDMITDPQGRVDEMASRIINTLTRHGHSPAPPPKAPEPAKPAPAAPAPPPAALAPANPAEPAPILLRHRDRPSAWLWLLDIPYYAVIVAALLRSITYMGWWDVWDAAVWNAALLSFLPLMAIVWPVRYARFDAGKGEVDPNKTLQRFFFTLLLLNLLASLYVEHCWRPGAHSWWAGAGVAILFFLAAGVMIVLFTAVIYTSVRQRIEEDGVRAQ
jgi:hypothetical protein